MEQKICSIKYNSTPIIKINHFLNKDDINLYIFLGLVEEEINKIVDKLTKKQEISSKEESLLKDKYGKKYKNILGLDNKYSNIYFIEDLINIDDTIDIIKRKIAIHLGI